MADQPQTARRHKDNCRECSCSSATLIKQPSTLNLSRFKRLLRDANVLWFGEETQRFFATFAADAALFHAAERDAQIAHEPAVYPHRACVNSLGYAMGATHVLRPDARGEAIFDVIGVIDHFFFAVEGRDCYDRAENFFAICAA